MEHILLIIWPKSRGIEAISPLPFRFRRLLRCVQKQGDFNQDTSLCWLAHQFTCSASHTVQVILFEIDCAIFYTNLHELFCQFISWTNWVNSGKFMDNCWISCQVMADMKKVYDDLIIINLYHMRSAKAHDDLAIFLNVKIYIFLVLWKTEKWALTFLKSNLKKFSVKTLSIRSYVFYHLQ